MKILIFIGILASQLAAGQSLTRKHLIERWQATKDSTQGKKLLFVLNGVFFDEKDSLMLDKALLRISATDIRSIDFLKCREVQFCSTGNDIAIINTGKKRLRKPEKLSIVH